MSLSIFQKIGWFVGLILLQVLILNNVHIFGYATPFLYVYLLLKIESDAGRNGLMVWAFFLGLVVDAFFDTPGMNASAAVLLAFVRQVIIRLFVPRDSVEAFVPSMRTMGISSFLKYVVFCVLVHHSVLLSIEFFSFAHMEILLLRIASSTLLTTACVVALEGFVSRKR